MSLDNNKVKEIAYLARLSIENSELEQSTKELNNILSLMDQLGEIDTGDAEPMAHPLEMSQRLRDDQVTEDDLSEEFQEIAPKTGNNHFLVPTVIE
ncbi:MAG: Asp-tRNA(Asn)/Glu-tRNA(Gln) amidotransferase subunit GatC [Thiotrichales bacterium]|jgi:aspartyl-tRNA(Asn)/glutamyl-tRNA(Gln) amidotransferase subunit C|nr:Asp-tRNA(Asn)/Glu-tRNA(Gln) amidotransferase subunit GatC [Thiotrichales bacterium]MDC3315756.1 Asp-tRNA(Asn)/Glu-tRNA(Gln) amidotransferase subunit GatC [Candidatus Thioglobus sp.]MBT4652854.1 Asp-tRNA(Asn)/Glu-tRNA(Gln) amidotransferase subunit GatC [Thiotrichales bacterium]MBT5499750.1 Asp-tRNA(Asn)/Glu-tRNA(Gln) amidotransferase subunit GatC [Thiotrichales bacterium]MBT5984336.1 Asp-tRNA(Asn)/Glu-tRNA(Gln) amidotransferase subunit GatC [Thiotrichales bacterium]|tara:strand:+ start:352 stop:639 length:288 start_codon:yes stop_codon:yes gene_type:complete